MENPLKFTTLQICDAYHSGELSPINVTKKCLEQIKKHNPVLNAICYTNTQNSLKWAKESETRWQQGKQLSPIDGVPFTVKDLIYTKDWPTLHGSNTVSSDQKWQKESPCVARMRDAGAILIAKTTTPEFGHKGVTTSLRHGVTRNPWDPKKTSGGSSGGAAVAAAMNMGLLHIGNDGGGSIRIPASFTGVFGFKPSPRLVPAWPVDDYIANQMSVTGPITRSVTEAALIMDIISQPDPRDYTSLPHHGLHFTKHLKKPFSKLKIAYISHLDGLNKNDEISQIISKALEHFSEIADVEPLKLNIPTGIFRIFWLAAAQHTITQLKPTEQNKLDPSMKIWGEMSKNINLSDYMLARDKRLELIEKMNNILDEYDFILSPTTTTTAFDVGQDNPQHSDGKEWQNWAPFTSLVNLAQLPAASIPCGFTAGKLPVGLQIIGSNLADVDVLRLAYFFEQNNPIMQP